MALVNVYPALLSAVNSSYVGTELSGNGYARGASTAMTYDPVGNIITMPVGLTFGPATGAWSAVAYVGFYDAATNGNLLFFYPFINAALASGQSITLPVATPLVNVNANVLKNGSSTSNSIVSQGTVIGTTGTGMNAVNVTAGASLTYNPNLNTLAASGATIALTDGATITLNPSLSPATLVGIYTVSINAAGRTMVVSPGQNGQEIVLEVTQGTASSTITTWTNVTWPGATPPTLSTTLGYTDVFDMVYNATTGKWRAFTVGLHIG